MNIKNPTIVIVNGANWVGHRLVELLLEQKGNVIVVDDFNEQNMPFIKHFSDHKHFVFIEKDRISSLKDNFTNIKYFIHLKHDFDTSDDKVSSKYFIQTTKFVDEVLSIALEKNSTYVLTSSIHLHKDFLLKKNYSREEDKNAYNESDLQHYIERTVMEYVSKAGLNGRVVRLGNVYGPGMDIDKDKMLKRILSDAVFSDEIRIYGDGLDYMYYVYISDAIQGVLKSLFTPHTLGKFYSITNPDEISVLSITNKILALQPKAQRIKFINKRSSVDPLYQKAYIPEENLTEIGWKPLVNFERGIAQVYDYFKRNASSADDEDSAFAYEDHGFDSLNFDFDDTINLSDTVLAPTIEIEHQQFQEFHKREGLMPKSTEDREGFFSKLKSKLFSSKDNDSFEEERPKRGFFKTILFLLFFFVIYIFLIVPVFRFGSLFIKINTATTELVSYIDHKKEGSPEPKNIENLSNKNFAGINWAVESFNQQSLKSDLINISRGIDNAILAYNIIENSNLNKYLIAGQDISSEDINEVQDVILLLNSAKSELQSAEKVNMPLDSNENITLIRNWTSQTENKFSEKLRSQ